MKIVSYLELTKIKHFGKYSASSCYIQNATYILLGATGKIFGQIQEKIIVNVQNTPWNFYILKLLSKAHKQYKLIKNQSFLFYHYM